MSKAALSFCVLAIMALAMDQLLPETAGALSLLAKSAAGVFACLFVVALILGRRFKFDPVLR
jgi:hypothetical protein